MPSSESATSASTRMQPHAAACTHLWRAGRLGHCRFVALTCWEEQLGPHLPAGGAPAPAARVPQDPGTTAFEARIHRRRSLLDEDALARALFGCFAHRVLVAVGDGGETF